MTLGREMTVGREIVARAALRQYDGGGGLSGGRRQAVPDAVPGIRNQTQGMT